MAKRKFKTDLSQKGIYDLIADLQEYKNNTFQGLLQKALNELLDMGIAVAESNVGEFGKFITFTKKVDNKTFDATGISGIMYGINVGKNVSVYYNQDGEQHVEISSILMAEFGSGVYAVSPKGYKNVGKGTAGRGTFPNQKHAFENEWRYATELDDKGNPIKWVYTSGIEPTSPMYKASMEMYSQISSVIRSTFR